MDRESVNKHLLKFPINLREFRKSKEFSQSDVAETLNISLRKYQRLESGEAVPKLDEIYKLTHLFKVGFEELLNNSYLELDGLELEVDRSLLGVFFRQFEIKVKELNEVFIAKNNENPRSIEQVARHNKFIECDIPLILCDFNNSFANEKFIEHAKKNGIDVPSKYSSSSMWKNTAHFLSLANKLIDAGKTYFTLKAEETLKCIDPQTVFVGFYSFENSDHFTVISPIENHS